MSNVQNFVSAQSDLLLAVAACGVTEQGKQDAFRQSAIVTATARDGGASGPELAKANKANAEWAKAGDFVTKGWLYTSPASIDYHAMTGRILSLPLADGETVPVPTSVQTLVIKAQGAIGTKKVAALVKAGKFQQAVMAKLDAAVKAAKDAKAEQGTGEGDGEGDEGGNVTPIEAAQTVSTLLSRVLAMVQQGATLTDADAAIIAALSSVEVAAA